MTDLTYCYLHMTEFELKALDTLEEPSYISGILSDDDMILPPSAIPPNPEEHDTLPSETHPSYPFGNPTHVKHPASRPRPVYDPHSRTLFEDMGFAPATVDVTLRWKELALNELLPVDEHKEIEKKAQEARKMASGGSSSAAPPSQYQGPPMMVAPGEDEESDDTIDGPDEDEDEEDEDEEDEDEPESDE